MVRADVAGPGQGNETVDGILAGERYPASSQSHNPIVLGHSYGCLRNHEIKERNVDLPVLAYGYGR